MTRLRAPESAWVVNITTMEWETELRDIVARAQTIPTFEAWIKTTGHDDLPDFVGSPLAMQSLMRTLYARYRRTFRIG